MKNNRKRFFVFIGKIIVIKVILYFCSILFCFFCLFLEFGWVIIYLFLFFGDGF